MTSAIKFDNLSLYFPENCKKYVIRAYMNYIKVRKKLEDNKKPKTSVRENICMGHS